MKRHKPLLLITLLSVIALGVPFEFVAAAPLKQGELAVITAPADNDVVRGVVSIVGSAVHPAFDRYELAYAVEPVTSNDQWVGIGDVGREQVVNGELAQWDTTILPDGSYSLRLRVVRNDGNYAEIEVKHVVIANAVPTETPTAAASATPTNTPTPLPPTPTIVIELTVDDTPTPRPLTVTEVLPTPKSTAEGLPIPKVKVDTSPLKSALLLGGGGMLVIFLFFGFLSAVRLVVLGFAKRTGRRRRNRRK